MEEKKIRNNRLFIKMYVCFAVVITVFAVLLGTLYMRMYESAMVEDFERQLRAKAMSVANRCSKYFADKTPSEWMNYLIYLKELEGTEIWAIANTSARNPLGNDMAVGLEAASLSADYMEIAHKAFENEVEVRTNFSEYHECIVVAVGVPVQGINGEVAGAIILNAPVGSQKEVVNSSWFMIFISGMIALVIAFIMAIPLTKWLTQPVAVMRSTALRLAAGNYDAKTGIKQEDEIGELARTIDFLADKLAESAAERKNMEQMRMDFFANVSHELRTPITVVRAYVESLVDGVVTEEEKIQQYYSRMLNECRSMERLVGDLLLLSKLQNPDFVVEKEPVNLLQIFKDLTRTAKTMADEKQIEIVMKLPLEGCVIFADYVRLRQMFLVILDNAIKFSRENSNIYITVEKKDKIVEISIKDEGVGISEEELPNIFEKFYRSKLRQNAKGSGLGLSIARHICLKHEGTLHVESKLGEGTNFIFTFPILEGLNA